MACLSTPAVVEERHFQPGMTHAVLWGYHDKLQSWLARAARPGPYLLLARVAKLLVGCQLLWNNSYFELQDGDNVIVLIRVKPFGVLGPEAKEAVD